MSRERARKLVDMSKEVISGGDQIMPNSAQIQTNGLSGQESPLPPGANFTTEYMEIFNSVFEDSREDNLENTLLNNNIINNDLNINSVAPESPFLPQEASHTNIERPSPLMFSSPNLGPLFSPTAVSLTADFTPMPSPYCNFDDSEDASSDDLNSTLVPRSPMDGMAKKMTSELSIHRLHTCSSNPDNIESTSDYLNSTLVARSSMDDMSGTLIHEPPSIQPLSSKLDNIVTTSVSSLCNFNDSTDISNVPSFATTCNDSDSSLNSTPKSKKRSGVKKTDLGRERLKHKEEWKDIKRKRLVNLGKSYVTRHGEIKAEKKIKPSCKSTCRLHCNDKISEAMRKELFSKFWATGDHVKQWDIISKYVIRKNKKMHSKGDDVSRRNYSLFYHLPIVNENGETEFNKVCKQMFLNTFAVGKEFVYTALEKHYLNDNFNDIVDGRGRHNNRKIIITPAMKQSVIDHCNSFVPIESHYVRKRTSKKYLDSSLSIPKMYKMYPNWCENNNYNERVTTVRQYRDVVTTNLNIGFHVPKKDQCDLCHQFRNLNAPSEEQINIKEKHIRDKELSRKLKAEDKQAALSNPQTVACAVFDFEKVLSSPHGNISVYYYKRKLNMYNFTIYDMGSKEAHCYMWHEQIAKRGANEVASCLFNYFSKLAARGVTDIRLWSDNCGGQNRNRIVFVMYLLAAKEFKLNIRHRFMEKGHTQNEGDSVHALIERTAKGREIYSPDEWVSLVRWAKVNEKPYNVIEVDQNMIYDFKISIKNKNWTKNVNQEKVSWNKIKEVSTSSNDNGVIFYKYSLDEPNSHQIECFKSVTRIRSARTQSLPDKAYCSLLKISKAKYTDLQYFCNNNIIPEKYHSFYRNVSFAAEIEVSEEVEE